MNSTRDFIRSFPEDDRRFLVRELVMLSAVIFMSLTVIETEVAALSLPTIGWAGRLFHISFVLTWSVYVWYLVWMMFTTFFYYGNPARRESLKYEISRSFTDMVSSYVSDLDFDMSPRERLEYDAALHRIHRRLTASPTPNERRDDAVHRPQSVTIGTLSPAYGNVQAGGDVKAGWDIRGDKIEQVDLAELAKELEELRSLLRGQAMSDSHVRAVAEVAQAEVAARSGDRNETLVHLRVAGTWALDEATRIGARTAVQALRAALGL